MSESINFSVTTGHATDTVTVPTAHMGNLIVTGVRADTTLATLSAPSSVPTGLVAGLDAGSVETSGAVSYLSIKQQNGYEFSASSLRIFETGNWNDTDTIAYAYKDGVLIGSVSLGMAMANNTQQTLTLSSDFSDIDEIRISRPNPSTGASVQIDSLTIDGQLPNQIPTINGIPGSATAVTTGAFVALPHITVNDLDGDTLTVTVTSTNATIHGLVDADNVTAGIQLSGTAAAINTALAAATFAATADGSATVTISVDDGRVVAPVDGVLHFTSSTPSSSGSGSDTPTEPQPNIVTPQPDHPIMTGTPGSDIFRGSSAALDTVHFSANRSDFVISLDSKGTPVSIRGPEGSDTLENIERIQFKDGTLGFDAAPQEVYRLYQATFGRVPDDKGIGFWIDKLDSAKLDLHSIAESFINSPEFAHLYGTPDTVSNDAYVDLLYKQALGRDRDQAGYSYWTDKLNSGEMTRTDLLSFFAESHENQAHTAAAISDGVWFA